MPSNSERVRKVRDMLLAKKKISNPLGGQLAQGISPVVAQNVLGQQANANVGQPQQGTREHPETARFRSFAERYMISRAHNFRVDHEEEDQWNCILNAKSAYNKIARVGANINPQIGDDTF